MTSGVCRHDDRSLFEFVVLWIMFLVRPPSSQDIERFVSACRELPLSYGRVGLANESPSAFSVDEQLVVIGRGAAAFERAAAALAAWRHFELGWVRAFPTGPASVPGTVVAVVVRHLGFWSMNGCRVVYTIGSETGQECGFAYGTLTDHAEMGEEIFKVSFDPRNGDVSYFIRAVARARAPLARLGYPVTRSVQSRFRRESARALADAIAE